MGRSVSVTVVTCPVCGGSGSFEDGGSVFQTDHRSEDRDGVWQNVPYLIQHSALLCKACGALSISNQGTTIDPIIQRCLSEARRV